MLPERCLPLDEDRCPVDDRMLGEIYRASAHGLSTLIATLSPTARAMLALYCYRRAHLASLGLAIATACEREDLVRWAGNAGAVLFERARQPRQAPATGRSLDGRRKITLATKAVARRIVFEDIADEETDDADRVSEAKRRQADERLTQDQKAELCPV